MQLDQEAGVNGTRIFVEVNHANLSGLGMKNKLTLSDTTVSVGLTLEL